MSRNNKIVLRYQEYSPIITSYLALPEFEIKASETMRSKRVTVTALCNYLGDSKIFSFSRCSPKDVTGYLKSISHLSSSTKSARLFILRHFFNHLYNQKITMYSGNELFPVIVTNKRDRVLSFYSEDEVNKVISSVDNTTPQGKRNLLIVLLAAELGMRSSDIRMLKLADIHWERNTIEFTQFKTGAFNQLPMLENIKYAMIDYLKNSRPICDSELVFVSTKNNYQMLDASRIHSIVSMCFKKAGVDISTRRHGPHALRHSLASNLLQNNTPMYVIKDVLGHANLNTTKIYLNIDFSTLAMFALEVPYETSD